MHLQRGVRVDRYTLVEPLGRGGQGSVWKVNDPLDGGVVRALKLIKLGGMDPAAVERARREARAVWGAAHPALVPCRGLFEELSGNLLGLVFDFVAGRSLLEAARDPRMTGRHREAALRQVADALGHVHGLGIVHRDLKPENVQVTEGFWEAPDEAGGVKLLDFGIAAPADNRKGLTAPGMVVGTRAYLAPELLAPGLWLPLVEGFTRDLFAFGVLGWELCCGGHPTGLEGQAPAEAYVDVYRAADAGQRAWPPVGLGGTLGAAVGACLQVDPRRRPPHGMALVAMLGGAAGSGAGVGESRAGVGESRAGVGESRAGEPGSAVRGAAVDVTAPTAVHAVVPEGALSGERAGGSMDPANAPTAVGSSVPTGFASAPTGFASAPTAVARSVPSELASAPTAVAPAAQPAGGTAQGALPAVPPAAPPPPLAQPTQSLARLAWMLALGGVLLAVTGAVLTVALLRGSPRGRQLARPIGSIHMPVLTAPPEPVATEPVATEPVPCCPKNGKCLLRGQACALAPCEDAPLPERDFWVQPLGVAMREGGQFEDGLMEKHPGAELCLRVGEQEASCAPVRRAVNGGVKVRVKTSDLVRGNVEIRVTERGKVIAADRNAPAPEGVLSSALCRGMYLHAGAKESAPVRVSVALQNAP
ncbi:protein kinase domain-containing protein [Chondromyces apiculatus]|uniref:Protein kinase domain-containing protein n=1 Tax=Chondromyces apiculatus DSM 436 TaxID=1192034 RepID=A0A017T0W0_9BACT|nr:protein kinase [Chondromyces apiculatus]EYF02607.1 Hypothetical protein CAP_6636 [Chondromyces apiculatus DSM 436]